MVQLKLKEILEKKKVSRYRLQLLTNLNYPRINQLYKNTAKNISFEEIEILTDVLDCSIADLIEKSK
ncbi:MAG: helix-turn-helix transcriptional regulator [Clostridia bacterium]|nr:helix-turn-helix transcriptional regulator [Clostridia bacterium]MCI8761084.1 helix-turn-helix transcriptional regulator [Clostridia bacterium]